MPPSDKQYELTFEERPAYLYVHLKGDTVSPAIIRDYIGEIVAKSSATGKRRILLHRDIPAVLSEAEVFHTVQDSLDALRGIKLALVNPHTDLQKKIEFGVTVGQNRGGNYLTFSTDNDAETWLLK